ncbi:MAG: HAMP domain-containing sensor histidine kinase, partial [bacterium]|nr:HAMP domain-containing sensor histidine kinase [bacterium]
SSAFIAIALVILTGVVFFVLWRDTSLPLSTIYRIALVTWILGMGIAFIIIRGNYRLRSLNNRLNDLLKENYEVGKILVRRDIELTEANARLMALDASKSEFVSVAAHQLRTPITGIRWSFNALLDRELGELNSDQQKMLEDGLKSSVRMIALINDLLNVARIEEGRFGLRFEKQSPGLVMQGAIDRHRKAIDEKGILLSFDMQPGLPSLDIDGEKMNIALDNIFDNAIKYTPPGGTIMVKISEEKKLIRISISDTGIGIPQNQIGKLFIKFFRAENALRFQTSGSGLGLYVVKNIIEAHGGTITVTSEENKGTTMLLTIPIPSH